MLEIVDLTILGWVIAGGVFCGILACLTLGRWVGRREIARNPEPGCPA